MGYITRDALAQLKKYKYSGTDRSITSRLFLNRYWTWLVTLVPTNIAPNTITLTGLSLVFLNFVTMLYYDPLYLAEKDGATGPPNWMYWVWGVSLFAYQSLDAIDGKQARRTGMAGPLGEMFDHGCDAINTTLECILCSRAMNLARSRWTVSSELAAVANFYLTTWEEYHTGTLYLGVFNGPTEGILMIVGIYFITAMYGTSIWDKDLFATLGLKKISFLTNNLPHYRLNEAFMVFGLLGLAYNVVTSYANVYKHEKKSGRSVLMPILRLLPLPISCGLNVFWLSYPTYNDSEVIHSSVFVPFLFAWGLQFAHQVGLMILAHVTKQRFPLFDPMWLWTAALAADLNSEWLFDRPPVFQTTPERRALAVYATLIISLVSYGRFVYLVINDITNYLGIACFTVQKKDKEGHWESAQKVDAQKKQP